MQGCCVSAGKYIKYNDEVLIYAYVPKEVGKRELFVIHAMYR